MINIPTRDNTIEFEIPNQDEIPEKFHGGTSFKADALGYQSFPQPHRPGSEALISAYEDASVTDRHGDNEYSFEIEIDDLARHASNIDQEVRDLLRETGEDIYVVAHAHGRSSTAEMALERMVNGGLDVAVYAGDPPYKESTRSVVAHYDPEKEELVANPTTENVVQALEEQ